MFGKGNWGDDTPLPNLPKPKERGVFKTKDGTVIGYEVHGDGPTLVLCYGLVCRREHWRHQVEALRSRYQIVLIDYRGHGASGVPPEGRLTIRACAEDCVEVLDRLKIQEAVFFGHSLGVAVAVEAALLLETRAKGLVLICGALANPFDHMFGTDAMNKVYRAGERLHRIAPAVFASAWRQLSEPSSSFAQFFSLQLGFHPGRAQAVDVRSYLTGVSQVSPEIFFGFLRDYTGTDRRDLLDRSTLPTLVIAGDEDYVTPLHVQQEMAERSKNGRIHVVPQGSHCAHTDFPELVNGVIEQFLVEIGFR